MAMGGVIYRDLIAPLRMKLIQSQTLLERQEKLATLGTLASGAIWLTVNGEERQRGDLAELIWRVPEVIAHLSALVALAPGDLIFTGTPAGVGPLVKGDVVRCGIDGLEPLEIELV